MKQIPVEESTTASKHNFATKLKVKESAVSTHLKKKKKLDVHDKKVIINNFHYQNKNNQTGQDWIKVVKGLTAHLRIGHIDGCH